MSITQALCNSYKMEILQGIHLSSDTYKMALYTSSAILNKNTTTYSSTGEVVGLNYTAGGKSLTGFSVTLGGDTAILDWTTDPKWVKSSITARGALIYNSSLVGKNAVCVLDFGVDKASIHDDFTTEFPEPNSTNGLIRIL